MIYRNSSIKKINNAKLRKYESTELKQIIINLVLLFVILIDEPVSSYIKVYYKAAVTSHMLYRLAISLTNMMVPKQ